MNIGSFAALGYFQPPVLLWITYMWGYGILMRKRCSWTHLFLDHGNHILIWLLGLQDLMAKVLKSTKVSGNFLLPNCKAICHCDQSVTQTIKEGWIRDWKTMQCACMTLSNPWTLTIWGNRKTSSFVRKLWATEEEKTMPVPWGECEEEKRDNNVGIPRSHEQRLELLVLN